MDPDDEIPHDHEEDPVLEHDHDLRRGHIQHPARGRDRDQVDDLDREHDRLSEPSIFIMIFIAHFQRIGTMSMATAHFDEAPMPLTTPWTSRQSETSTMTRGGASTEGRVGRKESAS